MSTLQAVSEPAKVAFLDRDGIINENMPDHRYVTNWSEFKFAVGAIEFLQGLVEREYQLVVVTNQQGIGKGLMSAANLEDIHEKMREALRTLGVEFVGIYHCPHLASANCLCRKPKIGLIQQAISAMGGEIDFQRSWLVGDSLTDIQAGANAGLRTILLANKPSSIAAQTQARTLGATVITELLDALPRMDAGMTSPG